MARSTGRIAIKKGQGPKEAASPTPAVAVPSGVAPAHPLVSLRREVDRLFEDFSSSFSRWPLGRNLFDERFWRLPQLEIGLPVVDVAETDKDYRVTAELPGMDEKDIEVTLSGDTLTIKGEKKEEKEETHKGYRLSERRFGMFHRAFSLPPGVEADKIAAEFSKGVLTVTLPKTALAKKEPKKIAVKSA